MKKLLSFSPLFLNIAFLFLPLCKFIAWLLDCRLTLYSYPAAMVTLTALLLVITVLIRAYKTELQESSLSFIATLPISFWIGWTFLILMSNWNLSLLCAAVSAVCVFVLFLTYMPSRAVKVVLSVFLIPLIAVSFFLASLLAFVFAV